jgi:hypothetical protein
MKKARFEVEDDKVLVWSLNMWNLHFSPLTLEKWQFGPQSKIKDYGQNWGLIMGNILV